MSNSIQCCFKRYEKKYLITREQQSVLLDTMKQHMQTDTYGEYTVCNIYYDTDDWKLIRTSIEKPVYKEKLRVRSYGVPAEDGMVFIELKKKYDGVVYKRRMTADAYYAKPFLCSSTADINETQIEKEIKWFQKTYHSKPKYLLPMNAQHSPEFQNRIYGLHLIPVSAGVIRTWIYALGIMASQ